MENQGSSSLHLTQSEILFDAVIAFPILKNTIPKLTRQQPKVPAVMQLDGAKNAFQRIRD
jgi:hypothetical protein